MWSINYCLVALIKYSDRVYVGTARVPTHSRLPHSRTRSSRCIAFLSYIPLFSNYLSYFFFFFLSVDHFSTLSLPTSSFSRSAGTPNVTCLKSRWSRLASATGSLAAGPRFPRFVLSALLSSSVFPLPFFTQSRGSESIVTDLDQKHRYGYLSERTVPSVVSFSLTLSVVRSSRL